MSPIPIDDAEVSMSSFAGYRTYIVAAAMAVLAAAFSLGWIDRQTYEMLLGLLTGAGLTTLRMGVKNDSSRL